MDTVAFTYITELAYFAEYSFRGVQMIPSLAVLSLSFLELEKDDALPCFPDGRIPFPVPPLPIQLDFGEVRWFVLCVHLLLPFFLVSCLKPLPLHVSIAPVLSIEGNLLATLDFRLPRLEVFFARDALRRWQADGLGPHVTCARWVDESA